MRIKMAWRNILRNGGRTIVSLLMIAGAVASIILFRGFAADTLARLRYATSESEYGHIQVATQAYWDSKPGDKKAHYIPDFIDLRKLVQTNPQVIGVSGRLSAFGLLSTGDTTVSAKMMGIEFDKEPALEDSIHFDSGTKLTPSSTFDVLLGSGLAEQLNAKVNDNVTALAYTLDNVINAVDFTVKGIYHTGVADFDNMVFFVPLKQAQILLNTQGIDKLTIRVRDLDHVKEVRDQLQPLLTKFNPHYIAKTWYEQSDFYRRVEAFYRTQNRVVAIILVFLILLGILNTIGMSVYERTGEIGTTRALGDTENAIVYQFVLEGFILGAIGVALGFLLGTIAAFIINASHLGMNIPGATGRMPIGIRLIPSAFVEGALVSLLASVIAAWIPSIRASRISIVEALKKNI